jgi:ribosomal protein L35
MRKASDAVKRHLFKKKSKQQKTNKEAPIEFT